MGDIDVGVDEFDADADDETGRLIRPYAITGGRTGGEIDISLEAQIQASTRASQHLGAYRWEAAKLVELVQAPMALIEIAARLEIPIGVARVLVADLVGDGAVVLHTPQTTQNYSSLLERVLDGVRNL
ncbi:MAG: DUF742 domain-containing protein [Ilumatobacter sp.]|uniref:DUF742 domain-containing protein n=1 Tax=Ilumatobacter sp. TaxID=1967498 RepID=UPI00260945D9|nr:DUF742 domain-containing protein [Ilumatobacter sp.]MDJ0768649.1 DUF742 domain-containing protein [Ilumatobacter sp.]